MLRLNVKYSVNNTNGGPPSSRELVITNWGPGRRTGGLF
ncbi:hypothetical protein LMG27177_01137 [Paraburkholderia fynbosensis]|uniref:Uncharacterized protein n=1 Tax=Paraburkholderia fynbosensis TaxID=1200993 RepID=A0A6J5FJX3_9BURK|nr:hypothetical protein LMG27177_01137 [Paraburkholderia fynbosensis]